VSKDTNKYKFSAVDAEGGTVTGVESAVSLGAAHIALLQRGLQPTNVAEKTSVLQFEITKKRVPRKEVMAFTRQLAVFMKAGIPIMDAMEIIVEETPGRMLKSTLHEMIDDIRAGDTFAVAASAHPEAFPDFYIGILESAELTGNLDEVLDQLADYINRDLKARSKVTQALIYPSVVAVMSVVTVLVMAVFVLPKFVTFFKSLHAKLPLPTRMMLGTSSFVTKWWYVILAAIVVIVIVSIVVKRSQGGKAMIDRVILRLPVFGELVQTSILERTCRILASMLRAGVDLPRALTIAADSANNAIYRNALITIRAQTMEGQGLAGPISRSGLFPGAARQMFRVGEETGTLDEQLEVASEYYNRELETKLEKTTALFEPFIIIVMGLIVGFVAIALISAMYGIYNQVHA
jgi:type IV pilus assembly protein PilC